MSPAGQCEIGALYCNSNLVQEGGVYLHLPIQGSVIREMIEWLIEWEWWIWAQGVHKAVAVVYSYSEHSVDSLANINNSCTIVENSEHQMYNFFLVSL